MRSVKYVVKYLRALYPELQSGQPISAMVRKSLSRLEDNGLIEIVEREEDADPEPGETYWRLTELGAVAGLPLGEQGLRSRRSS